MPKLKHYQMLQELNRQNQQQRVHAARQRLLKKVEDKKYKEDKAKPAYVPSEKDNLAYQNAATPTMSEFYNKTLSANNVIMPTAAKVTDADLLFFRSDTRVPKLIFEIGFEPRHAHSTSRPVYRPAHADVHPPSAVCLTRDITVAALLPAKVPDQPVPHPVTYIYLVACSEYFDTHKLQADIGFSREGVGRSPGQAQSLIYSHEVAAMSIPASDVLAAVRVFRTWKGASFIDGCSVHLYDWYFNTGSAKAWGNAAQLEKIKRALFSKGMFSTPTASSYDLKSHGYGYVQREESEDMDFAGIFNP